MHFLIGAQWKGKGWARFCLGRPAGRSGKKKAKKWQPTLGSPPNRRIPAGRGAIAAMAAHSCAAIPSCEMLGSAPKTARYAQWRKTSFLPSLHNLGALSCLSQVAELVGGGLTSKLTRSRIYTVVWDVGLIYGRTLHFLEAHTRCVPARSDVSSGRCCATLVTVRQMIPKAKAAAFNACETVLYSLKSNQIKIGFIASTWYNHDDAVYFEK